MSTSSDWAPTLEKYHGKIFIDFLAWYCISSLLMYGLLRICDSSMSASFVIVSSVSMVTKEYLIIYDGKKNKYNTLALSAFKSKRLPIF